MKEQSLKYKKTFKLCMELQCKVLLLKKKRENNLKRWKKKRRANIFAIYSLSSMTDAYMYVMCSYIYICMCRHVCMCVEMSHIIYVYICTYFMIEREVRCPAEAVYSVLWKEIFSQCTNICNVDEMQSLVKENKFLKLMCTKEKNSNFWRNFYSSFLSLSLSLSCYRIGKQRESS